MTTGAALRNSPRGLSARARRGPRRSESSSSSAANEPALPEAAGRIAESLNLALIALHREIKFVDVTEAVHRLIVAEQYEEVAFDRRVHETFTELSMKRASLPGIVDTAAQMLGEPVILEDLAHQALAVSAEGAVAATLLHDWERRSRRNTGPGGEAWTMTVGRSPRRGVGPADHSRTPPQTRPARRWCWSALRQHWRCTGWSNGTAPDCNTRPRAG